MQIENVILETILSGQRQHVIPVFQRPYSWTQRNWAELWSDLRDLVREGDKSYQHFLGPMIIDRGVTGSYDPAKHLVIDGQQRLITLSVLLCALRDVARKQEFRQFVSAVDNLLTFTTTDERTVRRLMPRSADRNALEKIFNESATSKDNRQQIVKAYRFFVRRLREELPTDEQEKFSYLNELYIATTARLKFVSITLDPPDDPTKIYESMNFKGKPLLVADLIRNYVLMQLPNGKTQDDFFASEWEPFEKIFASDSSEHSNAEMLEDFHYRFLTVHQGYFAKRLVYSQYKEYLKGIVGQGKPEADTLSALERLVSIQARYGNHYRRIVDPETNETDPELVAAFMRFSSMDAKTATPFLMSLYERYKDEERPDHITKPEFLEMINGVESFILRRSIMRLRTRGYGLDFAQAVKKSQNSAELWGHFDDKVWPRDDEIKTALVGFPLYLRERRKARLILDQLEISFGHKEQVDLRDPNIQIEHVMPRKEDLSPKWSHMLGDNADEIHANYLHTLGNLTLTGYNQELGAKSFDDKKAEYSKHGSRIALNKYIFEQRQWTEAEIVERAKQLTERFIEIWPRPEKPKRAQS